MRYAVVSDIHANQQAWKAVWLDIRSMTVDKVICLGDLIGYGSNPREVLESLYATVDYFVLGNHDAALCGKLDASCFNEGARDMIKWTSERLGPAAFQFISKMPLTLAGPGFRCAHGEFGEPARYRYVLEAEHALPGWRAVDEPLLFIGHTHRPCITVIGRSGIARMIEPEDFTLENEKRFLVNVGSVGQPRDWDPRASYCIYDTASRSIFWRRIPFDLDAYREALQAASIPLSTNPFLNDDPRLKHQPLRAMIPFNPPETSEKAVQNVVPVQHLDQLRRRVRRWKRLFFIPIAAAVLAAGTAGFFWLHEVYPAAEITGSGLVTIRAADVEPGVNLLFFPGQPTAAGEAIPKWNVHLGNRRRQQAQWINIEDEKQGFELRSTDPKKEMWISSAPINVSPRMRMTLQAMIKKSRDFAGSIAVVIPLEQRMESFLPEPDNPGAKNETHYKTIHQFVVKEPTLARADGWFMAKQTFELPAHSHAVEFQVRGRFSGVVHLLDLKLERK
jgi:predicted phosphodiesterase